MYQKRNKVLDVLGLFLADYNRQFYLREIARLTKIPLKTTQNIVKYLEKCNILKSSIRGRNKYFGLNKENPETKLFVLQAEVHKTVLFLEKYPLFRSFLKEIKTNSLIVVFGSFAKFQASKDSDVDILLVSKEKLPFHLLAYNVHKIELPEKIFIKALEKQETLIKEIEVNHIILNNHSLYVNLMWSHYGNK